MQVEFELGIVEGLGNVLRGPRLISPVSIYCIGRRTRITPTSRSASRSAGQGLKFLRSNQSRWPVKIWGCSRLRGIYSWQELSAGSSSLGIAAFL